MNVKVVNLSKDISRVIINEPKLIILYLLKP